MNNDLNVLIQLGDVDYRLKEIEDLKGDLPQMVESQKSLIRELKSENDEKNIHLGEIEQGLTEKRHTLDDTKTKLDKYKKQLYLVTTNKEYDALLTEIDHSKEILSTTQSSLNELNSSKDVISEKLKENTIKLDETDISLKKCEEELQEALNESEEEFKSLENKRLGLEKKVDNRYLSLYNRMRGGRRGVGITTVHKNACGSCYNILPPQTVIEIRKGDKIITCHTCGIILFWENED
ncbi:MAG: hypothetical protein CMF96_01890 [Candidatus Marinimicrobia bacterium]|nr:hypothetical protein [Candidatus Neomarinimicrobiota bacterium]|tara:strand:+ start:7741 stop:8451 length:711 start_codon:yes stop_codon:yes gene_type:complete